MEVEGEGEGELHDDAIAMLFLIAERANPASRWARYFRSGPTKSHAPESGASARVTRAVNSPAPRKRGGRAWVARGA